MQFSTVQVLADAGFEIRMPPDRLCECGCAWGLHVLDAPASPLDGGIWSCPWCNACVGTWDVDTPEDVKSRYRGH